MFKAFEENPFRLFFPIGAVCALIGVSLWMIPVFNNSFYPVVLHRELMVNGFLLSFVLGFLMTAIPRFTQTQFASSREIAVTVTFLLLTILYTAIGDQKLHFGCAALTILTLVIFGIKRVIKRKKNPPPTFIFVGIGLFLWLTANIIYFFLNSRIAGSDYLYIVTSDLFSNGALMALVLGVGGRLIPAILGRQDILAEQRFSPTLLVAVLIYLSSYLLQTILDIRLCFTMRSFVVLYFAIFYWKIYLKPHARTYLSWSLWICTWSVVIGHIFCIIWPIYYIHVLHLTLIGGFSLMALLISTRVVLAHTIGNQELEKTSRQILIFSVLIVTAATTRAFAPVIPRAYIPHLAYASFVWVIGFFIWSRLLYKINSNPTR